MYGLYSRAAYDGARTVAYFYQLARQVCKIEANKSREGVYDGSIAIPYCRELKKPKGELIDIKDNLQIN